MLCFNISIIIFDVKCIIPLSYAIAQSEIIYKAEQPAPSWSRNEY
jgi:hypothetical protein